MSVRILIGDVRDRLRDLDADSIDCVITSPPYWGLRDYGVDGQLGMEPTLGEHIANLVDATAAFSEAHSATFPPALVERCLMAGCPPGGTVLDPFGGSGTTAMVADGMGYDAVLIELSEAYAEIARKRIADVFRPVWVERKEPKQLGLLDAAE